MFVQVKYFLFYFFILSVFAEDYYDLLGVSKDADNRDIRRAFKKLALKMHPDKNQDDKDAHENFIKINKAYEVLKDEEMRKKYDLYGEEGLKDDFGKSWKGSYQSWSYYYESFGIYDDDPEIITLSKMDFEQSVLGSQDSWFINFYSPQCSHCHQLAPAWRELARDLEGIIRVGAVNCEEEWILCRQQNIHSYPSLIMYPQKEKYRGSREAEAMVEYVLDKLPDNVIALNHRNVKEQFSREEYKNHPWLISVCKNDNECIFNDVLRKLAIALDKLVNVAETNIKYEKSICKEINCDSLITYYYNVTESREKSRYHEIKQTEMKTILHEVLSLLPKAKELTDEMFESMKQKTMFLSAKPWLIQFTKMNDEESTASKDVEMKRLQALLPGVHLGHVDCHKYSKLCSSLYLRKFPVFIIFKPGGAHEIHHGRATAHDIATFARESLSSQVETLGPDSFPNVVNSKEPWFIDFFAPWCPPCVQLLPEWRKASRGVGHLVKFGTIDCTIHTALCNQHNIRSYPTTILYNQSMPHQFHGSHTQHHLEEFVKDVLNPPVISLTLDTFNYYVVKKKEDEMWAIDFFAPWCGPCQQLAPQWRALAKMFKQDESIHVAQVDCTLHHDLCGSEGINSYPTIRLYPKGTRGITKFYFYNGWNRDANSLQAWIYSFLPSNVVDIDESTFFSEVLRDSDPWIVDFYAPWCSHCQIFAPEFEKVAKEVKGKVRVGKVNCEKYHQICSHAGVRAYPTVMFYEGSKAGQTQNPIGEELHTLNYYGIGDFIENKLKAKSKESTEHDEL